jgi:branched-chain amino acid transport system substrate-binding protein
MMLSYQTRIIMASVLVLFIAACAGQQGTGAVVQPEPIVIGQIAALTGYGASWGAAEHRAIQLAVTDANAGGGINGVPIVLVTEDSRTDSGAALSAFNKLTQVDNIKYVIGTTWEADSTTIAPAAVQSGVILISPSSYKGIQDMHATTLFSTYPPYGYELVGMKKFLAMKGIKRFAIISNEDFFSKTLVNVFADEATKSGWSIESMHVIETDDMDFRTVLLKVREERVDAIYAPLATDAPAKGLLMKQLRELEMDIPVISTASTENYALLDGFGFWVEGILYAYPVSAPGERAFTQRYVEEYGVLPESPSAASAYDAANLLIAALRSEAKTPTEIAAYLHDVKAYPGASNLITFDQDGIISSKDYRVKTVRDGVFVDYS